jgi:hypothetical protein
MADLKYEITDSLSKMESSKTILRQSGFGQTAVRQVLIPIFLVLGLVGCQKASEVKHASDSAPLWLLESYDASKGYTFTKNMMAEYVATCLEPPEGDCTELLSHVGTFENLSVTVSGNRLLVATKEHEYHFKIVAVRTTLSSSDSNEKSDNWCDRRSKRKMLMSEEKHFGVECKNGACNKGIVLGTYMTRPERGGDIISFVVVKKAGRVKCPSCDEEHDYDQPDIREFPKGGWRTLEISSCPSMRSKSWLPGGALVEVFLALGQRRRKKKSHTSS